MQVLDVYRPKNAEGKALPVIVSVHGGGWVYGDKELYQYYCMSLAQRGFAVVNFTYRLAPEYQFPAPVEDTNSVLGWVLDNKEKYGMDEKKIFAVGDSAGAQILSLYADICTNEECAAEYELKIPEGLSIKAVALNCGQYSMENPADMTRQLMEEYLPETGTEEELRRLSSYLYVTEKFPPAYIMTAEEDFLGDQAPIMYQKLKEKIEEDLREVQRSEPGAKRVYALGGDPFTLSVEKLKKIGTLIRSYLPKANIGTYARVTSIMSKSVEELKETIAKFTDKDEKSLRRYRQSLRNI